MGSGFSALAAALVVGARKDYGRQALLPHNAVYVLLGAGLLWFGWFGFNGGSGFSTGNPSVLAFTNTLLTPGLHAGRLVRARPDPRPQGDGDRRGDGDHRRLRRDHAGRRLHQPGLGDGARRARARCPSYAVIVWRPRTRVDETLDVLAAHGIAGFTGILFIGFFAQVVLERRRPTASSTATPAQLGDQALAALAAPAYAFVATFVLLQADRRW